MASLQESLKDTLPYISSEHYVGLVSYSTNVTINLPIDKFDAKQRAYFLGEVEAFPAIGGTHTYDAILVALDMLNKKLEEVPDGIPMLFLLTDGEARGGYSLSRISPIVEGLSVPIYSIAYNYNNMQDLNTLSGLNEAVAIRADSGDIVNQLRNLFNTQL